MSRKKKPDCRACGACCVSLYDQDVFCDVTEKDMKRLGPGLVRKHVLAPDTVTLLLQAIDGGAHTYFALATRWRKQRCGPLKGASICACVFLNGSVLHRTSCRIYQKRPRVCRTAVKPGDRACLQIRRMMQEALDV